MTLHLVAGGAGFVGVNLAKALLDRGDSVLVFDDLSNGKLQHLASVLAHPRFQLEVVDCSDAVALEGALRRAEVRVDEVWHLAANSDILAGVLDPLIDLQRTFMTTFALLQVMRSLGVGVIHFSSSSAIYGDHAERVIHEDIGPLQPISNYGAMKLASEAQLRAAVEAWLPRANIFRFPNVVGVPATHGVMYDFCRKLKNNPARLDVLGNGAQQKLYLHVDDLVQAMLHVGGLDEGGKFQVFNIGPEDDGVTVRFIAETVRDLTNADAAIAYGSEERGWIGDVPRFRYSTEKLRKTGWIPVLSSELAVRRAAAEIVAQEFSN